MSCSGLVCGCWGGVVVSEARDGALVVPCWVIGGDASFLVCAAEGFKLSSGRDVQIWVHWVGADGYYQVVSSRVQCGRWQVVSGPPLSLLWGEFVLPLLQDAIPGQLAVAGVVGIP